MRLKTAIIGMGKMGRIRKKEFDAHQGFDVVAVCDVDPAVADEFPSLYFHTDWQALLQDCDLDVVVVCTYNYFVPDIVCAALEKGCHVFSEKPPGRTIDDVQKMIDAEKKAGNKVVKFGFNHRFHYSIIEAKSLVESGRYGKLLWARGVYGKAGGNDFEKSWRSDSQMAGGGILLDQGIHMLDLMRLFIGEFVEVKSFVENCYWNVPLEDNAFALMKSENGKVAMVHSSATHWKHKFSLDLYLENGYISLNGILSSTRSYGDESITFAKRQFEDEARAFGKPREETIYFDKDDSWKLEVEDFYNCISGKSEVVVGNTKDAYSVMKLIDDIYKAGKSSVVSV